MDECEIFLENIIRLDIFEKYLKMYLSTDEYYSNIFSKNFSIEHYSKGSSKLKHISIQKQGFVLISARELQLQGCNEKFLPL